MLWRCFTNQTNGVNILKHLIRLARQHDTFICPVNRVHLYFYNPAGSIEVISEQVKRALKNKKIVDINGTIVLDEEVAEVKVEAPVEPVAPVETEVEVQEPVVTEPVEEDIKPESTEDEGVALEDLNKDELLSFIKENGMTMKELGITSKSSEDKIRDAIEAHLTKVAGENEEAN